MSSTEIIFAQFGDKCENVEPSYSSIKKYFPGATFKLYCDRPVRLAEVNVVICSPPFDRRHYRYGNRANDYYKVLGLLESKADLAIAFDNDMVIVSNLVSKIAPLSSAFGACIPCNPRCLVRKDCLIGEDSDKKLDETEGTSYAYNMSPISFDTKNVNARKIFEAYCKIMRESPVRGPLAMWRAVWNTKLQLHVLPPQWCVCLEHCGIGNEIILHAGHQKVREYYKV